jgi:hypothetical protein
MTTGDMVWGSFGRSGHRPGMLAQRHGQTALEYGHEVHQQINKFLQDCMSTEEVAKLLGVYQEEVLEFAHQNKLFMTGNPANRLFPKWQFTEDGKIVPGLEEVLAALDGVSGMGKLVFFYHEKVDQEDSVTALRAGRVSDVVAAAKTMKSTVVM